MNTELSGVKRIRIHDFRHSCSSLLISKGADATIVAKYLGHAKIEETLNTYTHLFGSRLKEIVNILDDLE
jgi:integrase